MNRKRDFYPTPLRRAEPHCRQEGVTSTLRTRNKIPVDSTATTCSVLVPIYRTRPGVDLFRVCTTLCLQPQGVPLSTLESQKAPSNLSPSLPAPPPNSISPHSAQGWLLHGLSPLQQECHLLTFLSTLLLYDEPSFLKNPNILIFLLQNIYYTGVIIICMCA